MNLFGFLTRAVPTGTTKNVAVVAAVETTGVDPTPGVGESLVHLQRMVLTRKDGTTLDPPTTATPLAPLATVGSTTWLLAVDMAALVGCELQNDSDTDMLLVYAPTQPADGPGGDFGLRLRAGASRFFAPPLEASYRGKIWVRAIAGGIGVTNKTLRRNAW